MISASKIVHIDPLHVIIEIIHKFLESIYFGLFPRQ